MVGRDHCEYVKDHNTAYKVECVAFVITYFIPSKGHEMEVKVRAYYFFFQDEVNHGFESVLFILDIL